MKIGIPAWESDHFFGVGSQYLEFAALIGTPVILTPDADWIESYSSLDGILLPGGADVAPNRYGIPGFFTGRSNPHLEYFDTTVLPTIIQKWQLPVFGICRGLQTLNVLFGGTLKQHLFFHPYSTSDTDCCHKVTIAGKKVGVNSFHHQAIGELADCFIPVAISDDGLVEAIVHKTFKVAAVQWHPERIWDEFSVGLFKGLFDYGG